MHTLIVAGFGLLVLVACLGIGFWVLGRKGMARGALVFLPIWVVAISIDLWIGIVHTGYTMREEAPVFAELLLVFAIPSFLVWRRYRAAR
ncbi:MAG: hypothetical protein KDI19_15935 [Pseudomonadales bacterium]|nr:hypothetical protein [Pseudomonadales bacterium]